MADIIESCTFKAWFPAARGGADGVVGESPGGASSPSDGDSRPTQGERTVPVSETPGNPGSGPSPYRSKSEMKRVETMKAARAWCSRASRGHGEAHLQ
jgi:hypothetical protein